jgi:serine/threonine-protein kinase
MDSAPDPLIGTIVGDRYRIVEKLGAGGMASVYRGEHQLLRKGVAIKILLPEVAVDADMAARFEAEAVAAARLDHPNCVGISDFGRTSGGQLYLVMELIDGHPLSEVLGNGLKLPWGRAVEIARQLLRGLARAHELGIVHRDLKPANIMVSTRQAGYEVAKIIDFGIAKMVGESPAAPRVETKAGTVFGTADFIAPERLLGKGENDPRSDLYSVGVALYEMVTGVRPFHTDDAYEIIKRAMTEKPVPPSQAAPEAKIPARLEAVIMRALEKEPGDRFGSAREFLAALDVEELRTSAHPVLAAATRAFETEVASRQALASEKRKKVLFAVGGVALLALLVVTAIVGGSGGAGGKSTSGLRALPPFAGGAPANDAAPPVDVDAEVSRLVAQAGEGRSLEDRQSAADRLVALGFADRVPRGKKLALDLHQEPTCEARLQVLEQLEKLKDPSTLTSVRMASESPGNDCLQARAKALADVLSKDGEARSETPVTRPTQTPARSGGGRKKSTRGGHF